MLTYLLLLLLSHPSSGFSPSQQVVLINRGGPLFGIPFLGRFRKKKPLVIQERISVGAKIPEGDVEMITTDSGGKIVTIPVTMAEVLGDGTSILVGMPGAFTPTCTSEHLPGYISAAPKLRELGVDKIAVVTTNDRYVNEEWARSVGLIRDGSKAGETTLDGSVTILADGDGDFVRSIGLAEDMGFGVGIRSKRFAMIAEGGTVTHLVTDDGMDNCSSTSATALLEYLTPPEVLKTDDGFELGEGAVKVIGAGIALIFAFSVFSSLFGGDTSVSKSGTPVPPMRPAIVQPVSGKKVSTPSSGSDNTFSLLRDYR